MDQATKNQIETKIKENRVFLFMKGTPEQPMCGFSGRCSPSSQSNWHGLFLLQYI